MEYYLIEAGIISFVVGLFLIQIWMRKAEHIGLMWDDMNKIGAERVAGSGGVAVIIGFVAGVFFLVAYQVFLQHSEIYLLEILTLVVCLLMLAGIGFVDDLFGWQRGGLSIRSRLILVLLSAVPLVAINAGKSIVSVPFIGVLNLGIIYPLVIVPIGILGAATTFNFLAGFNGLEAGQGMILLSASAIVAYFTGNLWISAICILMVCALAAFLIYNVCPAKVFPGDVLTYPVGGLLAIVAILGNFEKIAVFFFIPYIAETVLKLRGGLKKHSFGKPNKTEELDLAYGKLYGLGHVSIYLLKKMGIRATEKNVVYTIWMFQLVIILLGFAIFKDGIFIK